MCFIRTKGMGKVIRMEKITEGCGEKKYPLCPPRQTAPMLSAVSLSLAAIWPTGSLHSNVVDKRTTRRSVNKCRDVGPTLHASKKRLVPLGNR